MTTPPDTMHPFVALMRRYCIDYTNSHDQSIYPEIFVDDYTVNINGVALDRDTAYGPLVEQLFAEAPGLGLTVHELVLNGDRLCMRFSEHAAMPTREGRRVAAWRGIGLYKWDGQRLVENFVEQDFLGRRAQLATGEPDELEPAHLDPWMSTVPTPADPDAEEAGRAAVLADALHTARWAQIDDLVGSEVQPLVVSPDEVTVNDVFSAGRRVAVHATLRGRYRGGIDRLGHDALGQDTTLQVAALLRIDADGSLDEVRAVSSRDAVFTALRPPR